MSISAAPTLEPTARLDRGQLHAQGLHSESFENAVAAGLNLIEFRRAVRNGLVIRNFSQLLEFGYPIACVNDALEIANNTHENIPAHQCRIGKRQFRGDINTYLERIWLLGQE